MLAEKHFKIRVNTIIPNRPTTFDLFLLLHGKFVHYLRAGDSLPPEKIQSLNRSDLFHVPESQRGEYKKYIFDRLNESELNPLVKASILRESSMTLAEEIFENPDVSTALESSKEVVGKLIEFMEQEPAGMAQLIGLSSHDFYTYNHSLDVSIYALGLGQILNFSSADLVELGRGAIFHDIGKRNVHVDIICKKGPLDNVEWAQMQKHPEFGLKILSEYACSEAMIACCFEHHESFLGNGYPQQLQASEIHPMARICAITDTFDALTTKRSYNQPMLPNAAIEFMTTKLAGRYDPDMLKALKSIC